jgi:hypothetical protein
VRSDLDPVAVLEQPLLDALAVDEGAVQTALVLQHHADRLDPHRRVAGRYGRAGQHDVVLVVAAELGDTARQLVGLILAQPRAPDQCRPLTARRQRQIVAAGGRIDDPGVADFVVVPLHG